ncbi:DUF1149 family protein [Enterococcus pallens]|uniref:Uncharacterized protein n=1 Tax=Enterococcus pallens ATCC BAA-351 TaxID=1158607 RepID=R2SWR1_9ENTE|nr:DUF1149 family protein [Enterococcus pallens]EOH92474.1 hypothetical protein UAU_02926 [Enterococcus pallens ATCC BAA-351]EOU25059.1 hypothetical protein I588_01047 [Enterococcus pallens ATCC BAA-351]OJG76040.1 hypothetical protein RV10_GL004287 [Enterococcus pallens]
MNIHRRNPLVEAFHYDRVKTEQSEDQVLNLSILPLETEQPEPLKRQTSTIGLRLDFTLTVKQFKVTGSISQINHIKDKVVETREDLTESELSELAAPLLELVQRLTYEISEIALNEPGTMLAFNEVPTA